VYILQPCTQALGKNKNVSATAARCLWALGEDGGHSKLGEGRVGCPGLLPAGTALSGSGQFVLPGHALVSLGKLLWLQKVQLWYFVTQQLLSINSIPRGLAVVSLFIAGELDSEVPSNFEDSRILWSIKWNSEGTCSNSGVTQHFH